MTQDSLKKIVALQYAHRVLWFVQIITPHNPKFIKTLVKFQAEIKKTQ